MRYRLNVVAFGFLLAACSRRSASVEAEDHAATKAAAECPILTVADIQAITGASVKPMPFGATAGAGGTCANYTDTNGHAYLGVNRLTTEAQYAASVAAVPQDVYPSKIRLEGVGDEGVLFSGPGHIRYLVARLGRTGVVIFPLTRDLSDEQLKRLAGRALDTLSRAR